MKVLESDFLTQGPKVKELEEAYSKEVESDYSVAVTNGTAALHLAVKALGLKKGQKVLVTPLTFIASANCVLYEGGEVEFVDIDPDTFNIDLEKLSAKIESSHPGEYVGVIVVDFAGLPVNTEKIYDLCKSNGMWVIEDAAHAPGGSYVDTAGEVVKVGSCKYSDATTFSFHPAKHIACGEGGLVTAKDKKVFERLSSLRTHGIEKLTDDPKRPWLQDMKTLGFNFRMSDINAALGVSQLKKLRESVDRRNEIASFYNDAFKNQNEIETPKVFKGVTNAHHLFVVKAERRDELFLALKELDINCQIHYVPAYRMTHYKNMGMDEKDFPECENYFEKCISLPMYPSLSSEELAHVAASIKSFYKA